MNKLNIIVLTLFIIPVSTGLFAQDVHFSQFRETPTLLNPAMTALDRDVRIILNYKDQWRSVASPYKTFAFSGEMAIGKKKNKNSYLGIGVNVFSDKSGDSQMGLTVGSLNLSAIVKTGENSKLGIGLMGGFGQRSVNYNQLRWENQYQNGNFESTNPTLEPNGSTNYTLPDAAAGIAWTYGKGEKYISANNGIQATIGVGAHHFGFQKYSFYKNTAEKLFTKFVAHANLAIGIPNSSFIIAPGLMYTLQGPSKEILVGSMFKYVMSESSKYTGNKKGAAIGLGLDYRFGDAAIATLLYEFSSFGIGISYDVNVSKLKTVSSARGGFEIALRFVAPNPFNTNANKARI
jgi:type IX secretion system PorP/SprF family membrane protein